MSACKYRLSAALLVTALAAGCTLPDRGRLALHAAGYSCDHLDATPGGLISAQATPDYRGAYDSLTLTWKTLQGDSDAPKAEAVWTSGPKAISPPGWLTVSHVVDQLPPKD